MEVLDKIIDQLVFDPINARKHPVKNIEAIKGSLTKFGQQKPIVINSKSIVIAGNGTLMAAKALGWKNIKVIVSDLNDLNQMAFALADNRTSELAEWDQDILSQQLAQLDLNDFDTDAIGFEDFEIPDVKSGSDGLTDPDDVPEVAQNVFSVKRGDVWLLGNHRLMCGDSTDENDVKKLMNGNKLDITFTSPPYNAGCFGFDDGKSKYKKKGDDDLDQEKYFDFLCKFTDLSLNYSKYVFFNNQFLSGNRHALAKFFGNYAKDVKDVFPWIKNTAPPNVNKGVFTNRFEFFLCLEKGNEKKVFPVDWQGKYNNVIEGSTASSDNVIKGQHSATMPIYVPEWFFERLDFIKTVYEPFCGSGTTLIASEKTGRTCYGMELDEHYCSVIIKRWQDFSGKQAVKNGGVFNG